MSRIALGICLLSLTIVLAGCGGAKNKVANENEAKPGRDKELYEDAMKKLRKGRYDESRLLFNVVITTYPDSEYLPLAKLAIADSFYREGGTSALEQAIGGYKDFAQYFPTHRLNCAVKLKIAHAYMRQMNAYNRDAEPARRAEFQLQATLQSCQTSELKPEIETNLQQVQQVLGLHELDVARFYFHNRQSYKSAEGRLTDIVKNYPYFTYRDEALFLLGVSRIEQEQAEEAAMAFTDLLRTIPTSEFAPKAKEYLERLGRPIPEPATDAADAPARPGMMGRIGLIMGRNDLTISEDGVLVSAKNEEKSGAAKTDEKASEAPVAATGSVRARVVNQGVTQTTTTNDAQPTAATPAAQPVAKPSSPPEASGDTSTEAGKGKDEKKDEKKDAKKDDKKSEKKKGGVLGIFR